MKKILTGAAIGASSVAAATGGFILLVLLAPLVGALLGWIVGGAFPDTSRAFLDGINMGALSMAKFTAMIAFFATFFKRTK